MSSSALPGHKQCARSDCEEPRADGGNDQYCSALCRTVSIVTHGGPLPALPEWSWAPPNSTRIYH